MPLPHSIKLIGPASYAENHGVLRPQAQSPGQHCSQVPTDALFPPSRLSTSLATESRSILRSPKGIEALVLEKMIQ